MISINSSKFVSEIPNRNELNKLSIVELVSFCTFKKRAGKSFKSHLIDYLMSLKKLN